MFAISVTGGRREATTKQSPVGTVLGSASTYKKLRPSSVVCLIWMSDGGRKGLGLTGGYWVEGVWTDNTGVLWIGLRKFYKSKGLVQGIHTITYN